MFFRVLFSDFWELIIIFPSKRLIGRLLFEIERR